MTTGEAERSALVTSALAAADAKPDAERIRVAWRTSEIFATVIELPVDKVVLNPNSHRIRAQLESSPERDLVRRDPFGAEAQAAIEGLLRDAEEFDDLKVNLRDVGQIEPGVVTSSGLLVNANTRCVALRDNRARYIRAAVLPPDATQEEIDRLELRLQMKRDFHSDYTFTNELLFIEDLVKQYRYQPDQIALEMGWASKSDAAGLRRKAEQARSYLRMLALIRDVQEMSSGRLKIVNFDSNRQAIMELDEEFERLKSSDFRAAQELKEARLVALLAGAGYRELRAIDAQFLETYLIPAMEDRPGLRPHVEVLTARAQDTPAADLTGLDVLEDVPTQRPPASGRSAAPMLGLLTRSVGEDSVVIESADGERHTVGRSYFCDELRLAVEGAAEDVRLDREEGDLLNRPLDLVRKATKQVRAAVEAYAAVKDRDDFDAPRMRAAVTELGTAQAALAELVDSRPDDQ
jgi:hypothetical protein